ncbi:MAG: Outer membrane protein TolC precursor [bacterium ADurb.Bin363]|jgi:outer membrane protein|nr:MAG: Outer membrane protein TolC precursor [bacterium ADurb.Bin363]
MRIAFNKKILAAFGMMLSTFVLSETVTAQTPAGSGFTVQQAIEYALKNETNVKNAQIETQIAQAKINELIGVGLPQVKGSADINKFIEIPTSFVPGEFFGGEPGTYAPVQFGQNYSASAGLSASQLLFDGSYLVGLQASRTYADLSRKGLQQSKIDVAVNVSKAYYFVLVAEERFKQLESDIQRIAKLKSDTKALFDNGFVEKIDYDRVELNYNLLESARNQTKRVVENSYLLLKFQMGMDLKTPITLTEKIDDVMPDIAVINTDSVQVSSRIEYSILETQHRLTELDVKKNQFSRLPSLVLFGNVSANASRNEFNIFNTDYKWYPTAIIGASLSVPIFGGFQKYAQTKQAKLAQLKVENAFYALEQGIKLEFNNAVTGLKNNIDNLETQKKNRELAREIARVSKIKYDQGVGSNLEVVDAETSLREAEANYYTALLETIISKIELDKASGTIKY